MSDVVSLLVVTKFIEFFAGRIFLLGSYALIPAPSRTGMKHGSQGMSYMNNSLKKLLTNADLFVKLGETTSVFNLKS